MIVWFVSWTAYGIFDQMGDQGIFALGDLAFSVAIMWTNVKLFLIETHHKNVIELVAFSITVGGWWLWNIFLSEAYGRAPTIYGARNGFTEKFGKDLNWWLTVLIILMILLVLQVTYKICRRKILGVANWIPGVGTTKLSRYGVDAGDLDYWQELEKDPQFLRDIEDR